MALEGKRINELDSLTTVTGETVLPVVYVNGQTTAQTAQKVSIAQISSKVQNDLTDTLESKQDKLTAGEGIEISEENVISAIGTVQNIETISSTSGTIALETNKVYKVTITADTTFTLPSTVDNTIFNQIYVQLSITGDITVNLGTTNYFIDEFELESGLSWITYEYNSIEQTWYVGKIGGESSGGSSGGTWGSITGTLSDQTDLQTALDNKADKDLSNATPTMSGSTDIAGYTNFSSDYYIITQRVLTELASANTWEVVLHVQLPSSINVTNTKPLFCTLGESDGGFEIGIAYSKFNLTLRDSNNSALINTRWGTLSANSEYWFKLSYDSTRTYPYNAEIATDKDFTQNVQTNTYTSQSQGTVGSGNKATFGHYAILIAPESFDNGVIFVPDCKVIADAVVIFDGSVTSQYDVVGNPTELTETKTQGASYIIESYKRGNSWYRIWSDGWCEQGGKTNPLSADGSTQITFLKPFIDTNYKLTQTLVLPSGANAQESSGVTSITPTGCTLWMWSHRAAIWSAAGYIS